MYLHITSWMYETPPGRRRKLCSQAATDTPGAPICSQATFIKAENKFAPHKKTSLGFFPPFVAS